MRQIDYGLISGIAERYGLRDVDPRDSWAVMQLLERTYHTASERDRKELVDSHPWFFQRRKESPQLEMPLWANLGDN